MLSNLFVVVCCLSILYVFLRYFPNTSGFENGKSFLSYVDLYGSNFEDDIVTTGYGAYLAAPLLRKKWRADMSEAEAKAMLEEAMRVLYYRDCRTINRFQLSTVTAAGVNISEPYEVCLVRRMCGSAFHARGLRSLCFVCFFVLSPRVFTLLFFLPFCLHS